MLPEPETVVTIDPLEQIPGAERVVVDGVGIDIPAGVTAETFELSEDVTQLVATGDGEDRAHVIVTVTRGSKPASDADVFLTVQGISAQLPPDVVPEVEEVGIVWERFPRGWGLQGQIDVGDGPLREFLYAAVRDDPGTRVIGISVEARDGAVEDSVGYEMLRTVGLDEG